MKQFSTTSAFTNLRSPYLQPVQGTASVGLTNCVHEIVMSGYPDEDAATNADLMEWLAWAEAHVTRLNPLANRVEFPRDTSW